MIPNLTAILTTLIYTAIFSHLLPLVFFLLFKLNNKERSLRVILFYIVYCIFNEGLSFYFQTETSPFTLFIFSVFTIIEYSIFCYFIYLILPENSIKKWIKWIWSIFIVFAIIDFYQNNMRGFDSFASGIESIIIIILCIYYLYLQIRNANNSLLYSTFNFWVIIAFLIYFAGTFFLYIMTENLFKDPAFRKLYDIINLAANILKNLLLAVAMTMKMNKTNELNEMTSRVPNLDDDIFFQQPH